MTSLAYVAQAWRSGDPARALLNRLLRGSSRLPSVPKRPEWSGERCAKATSSVIDAHVTLFGQAGNTVVTSAMPPRSTPATAAGLHARVEALLTLKPRRWTHE